MDTEERMTIDERRKYLRIVQKRCRRVGRGEKGRLLDEAQRITGLHRKSLIRLLGGNLIRKRRRKQRGRRYGLAVQLALKVISESVDHVCAERVQPNLVWLAQHLAKHGELEVTRELLDQLRQISIPTVRRILRRVTQDQPRLPRKGPTEANRASRRVPIGRIEWDVQEPGHFEADLVHHSGHSTRGLYVHTLQMIDVATGWSERVAVLGRANVVILDGLRRISTRLPFAIRHVHTDNGAEFVNDPMISFWETDARGVTLSRGRPHHKNDQRFVEQKNDTLVRKYLGYGRLDTVVHTQSINVLYKKMWRYYNFFQPVMRQQEKQIVTDEHGRRHVRRSHDQARTPFDRLCKTGVLAPERRQFLVKLRDRTNPRELRKEIYALLEHILSLPGARPEERQNVYDTLLTPQQERFLRHLSGNAPNSSRSTRIPKQDPTALPPATQGKDGADRHKLKESSVTLPNDRTIRLR